MPQSRDAESIDLRSYLHVLRRRKLTVALVTLGLVVSTVVASLLQSPVYEGVTEILLQPRGADFLFDANNASRVAATRTVETEIRVMRSDPVRNAVREKIGTAPKVSAVRLGETEVMEVRASSGSASRAALIANSYAEAYVDFRRNQATEDSLAAAEQVQFKIDELQSELDAIDRQIAAAASGERAATEARLRPRYTSLLTQQSLLSQKLDQLQVIATLNIGGAQVVRSADVPTSPASPKPLRNGLAALAVGLVAGIGLAFVREHLDDSIKNKEDLGTTLRTLPVLASIPDADDLGGHGAGGTREWLRRTQTPTAEAYRSLRTSVQLLGVERPIRTLQVTSPIAGDGKTTTLANLAVVLAMAGQRVVMVDCDLRRPRLHTLFGLSDRVGFTSLLLGSVSLREAVQRVPGSDELFLLSSGPQPANPSELLSLKRTAELIFDLQTHFDMVLIDSAPVLPVTDATVLAAWVEATMLVTSAGTTTRTQVTDALDRLKQVDAPVVGAVLNRAPAEQGYGYRYDDGSPPRSGFGRRGDSSAASAQGNGNGPSSLPGDDGAGDPGEVRARPS